MATPPNLRPVLVAIVSLASLVLAIWLVWRRQLDARRRAMQAFYTLSQQILASPTAAEIAEKLTASLPSVLPAGGVRLHLWNRRTSWLESVPTTADPEPRAVSLTDGAEGLAAGAVKCFHDKALLHIKDVRRSSLVNAGWKSGAARSAMFAPLLAQEELWGVIEVVDPGGARGFAAQEQALLQHLATQVAAALKLGEQQTLRGQLLRSEKLAATGQLISGVASDLRAPLARIRELAESLPRSGDSAQTARGLLQLDAEARRAAEIVSRLVSFAQPAETGAHEVDVNALTRGLMQFREPEWRALGLRVQDHLSPEPAMVLGVEGQIEQVMLNLLVSAEQSAARAPAKTLEVASSLMAGHVVVEIHYPEDAPQRESGETSLEACRAIVNNLGGELRVRRQSGGITFDVDLLMAPGANAGSTPSRPAAARRALTFMLVDNEAGAQHQLLGLLSARGHRVVPARSEEAADLAHRLRFDSVVWVLRPGGPKWSDFQERLRDLTSALILVSDGYDAELPANLQENCYLLRRPLQEPELDRVLSAVEWRAVARV